MSNESYPVTVLIGNEDGSGNPPTEKATGTLLIPKRQVNDPEKAQLCCNQALKKNQTYKLEYTTKKTSTVTKVVIKKTLQIKGTHHYKYEVEPLFTVKLPVKVIRTKPNTTVTKL